MQMLGSRQGMGGGAGMDDGGYSSAPPARQQPANAGAGAGAAGGNRPAARPAPNFSDMDDDIPF